MTNLNDGIWPLLSDKASPLLRLACDTIPNHRVLVYKYLTGDFLNLIREQVPTEARHQILKATLEAMVELHGRDVVHLDIMVDWRHDGREYLVEQVQLADLENAAHLPTGRCI